ncbi:monoamine oxidase [Glaciihabitans tibetensis]|uniref:Monoamine oxidase n=1 Tax=Glaciihabitans tibetensis TaxID=1266600 RepID=A0A2T0VKE4_9MICO|nr:NAD(P)/FAD-dependent oxidoreductase [Glaciihabitans tibetensis]PRY70595.1 monoamine oxidase [Glaciihabitans tibetensis]
MSFTRRSFLLGAGSGLSLLVLTACTDGTPTPRPTTTGSANPSPSPVPRPAALERSAWSADPFARGTHSFVPAGGSPASRLALAAPVLDRVFFAGEATSADRPATVLGAQRSGARAAGEVSAAAELGERVAVIGAGVAGAETARLLNLYGFDVVMLEAQDRVGGRIHTIASDDWPVPPQLGAWTFTEPADAEILAHLERLDVQTAPVGTAEYRSAASVPAGDATVPDNSPDVVTENTVGATAVATALDWASRQTADPSLQRALDDSGATDTAAGQSLGDLDGTQLLGQQLAVIAATSGAAASDLSSWYGVRAPSAESADSADSADPAESPASSDGQVAVVGDLAQLVETALESVETFLSTPIVGIAYSDDGVSLRLGTGESLSVDRVVVTVPLGVLQNDVIEFDPLLPFTHRGAIADLGFGTVNSVWLRFDEPFWTTEAAVWNVVGTDTEISTWYNLQAITGEPVLVGVVGGAAAVRLEGLNDDELVDAALASLAPFAATAP